MKNRFPNRRSSIAYSAGLIRPISLAYPLVLLSFFGLALSSCGRQNSGVPDVSGVEVNTIRIDRFDTAFFSLDSNNILPGLYRVSREYPYFINDFISNILGAGPLSDTNRTAFLATREFLVSYLSVRDSLEKKYPNLDWLEKELKVDFQYLHYYFPKYPLPRKVVAFIGPFDGPGVAVTSTALAIGLQSYAGKSSSFYLEGKGLDLYPPYLSRRFEPAYIGANCVSVLAEDLFPDSSDNKPLIEQMVAKGKYWWLENQLQPNAPDSIRTGFTQNQLNWCNSNEGGVWNFFLQNTDLYTLDPDIIKNYIGEGPKTLGLPDGSPGNIGAWVGWQIVKKYAADHAGITPERLMRIAPRQIFEDSKYKPK